METKVRNVHKLEDISHSDQHKEFIIISEHIKYVNTHQLARSDLMLLVNQLISNLLAQIGNLKFKKFKIYMQSGLAEFISWPIL